MKSHFAFCLVVFTLALLAACAPASTATPLPTATETRTATAITTFTPMPTFIETALPTSTATPTATATRVPTATAEPTPKPTEIPQAPPERNFVTLMGTTDYSTFAPGGTGAIVKDMYKGTPGISQSGIGIVRDGLFFHTNDPNGVGSIEPPTKQELDYFRAGKATAPLGARKIFGDIVYMRVQKSYWLDNGKFAIDFIDDQNRTISLLMRDNEVLTNFGYMALYIVPNEKANPGLVRSGDSAAYTNATEYLNAVKNIPPGSKVTLDKTDNPNDPNSALVVISMGGF